MTADDFRIMTPGDLDLACPEASVLFDRDLAERVPHPFFCMSPSSWQIADLMVAGPLGLPAPLPIHGSGSRDYLYVGSATDGGVIWCWDDEALRWDDLSGGRWAFPWLRAWERVMELARVAPPAPNERIDR